MPQPPGWGTSDCAWSESTPQAWVAAVNVAKWNTIGTASEVDGYEKKLDCPRCTHAMSVTKLGGVIIKGATDTLTSETRTEASCNCRLPHTGRPEKIELGCGQFAWVKGPP